MMLEIPLSPALTRRLSGTPRIVMLDIDGTLAAIAPRPEDAVIDPRTLDVLGRLAGDPRARVAVVSGRAAEDARRLVATPGIWVVGNHGIEVMDPAGEIRVNAMVNPHLEPMRDAADALRRGTAAIPGVLIEDKRWTLSLHHRLADRSVIPKVTDVVMRAASARGLVVTRGKEVLEVRPPILVNKGTAVIELARGLGARGTDDTVIYIGDDRTDEDAFHALRTEWPAAVTVRVAPVTTLTKGRRLPKTHAEFCLPDPDAVRALLDVIATL